MGECIQRLTNPERYHDGISLDYSAMMRMWSAFDRSLSAFNRRCGGVSVRPAGEEAAEKARREDRKG